MKLHLVNVAYEATGDDNINQEERAKNFSRKRSIRNVVTTKTMLNFSGHSFLAIDEANSYRE